MTSFLGNQVKKSMDINDEIIANSMVVSASGAANAYLNAALTSTTPELRAAYGVNLNQVLGGQSALTELVVNKGWENPYKSPTQQLTDAYEK